MGTLRWSLPGWLKSNCVRLVVVDSVGALFRAHLDEDIPARSKMLVALAAEMKALSEQLDVAFVVINQVTDSFATDANARLGGVLAGSTSLAKRAALGQTWSHCVNTRILLSLLQLPRVAPTEWLSHDARVGAPSLYPAHQRRLLQIVLSPCVVQGSCEYIIDASGIRDAPAGTAPQISAQPPAHPASSWPGGPCAATLPCHGAKVPVGGQPWREAHAGEFAHYARHA
jgi:hypothetical protein